MDYWYKRAAIVLWHASDQLAMDFILNYNNVIHKLYMLSKDTGNETKITEILVQAKPYLCKKDDSNELEVERDDDRLHKMATIALYMKDPAIALSLLSFFTWKTLNGDVAALFAKLQIQYGMNWCFNLLRKWRDNVQDKHYYGYNDSFLKPEKIKDLASNFLRYGGNASVIAYILEIQSSDFMNNDIKVEKLQRPIQHRASLPKKIEHVKQILESCAIIHNTAIVDKMIKHLIAHPALYPEMSIIQLLLQLQKLQAIVPQGYFSIYQPLKAYLVKTMTEQLDLGIRNKDDWSILVQLPCPCEHCKIALDFLHVKTETIKVWPIVAAIRGHIMDTFKDLDLPVTLSVEKRGSPHKLVMEKTMALHTHAHKKFSDLKLAYQKLQNSMTYI